MQIHELPAQLAAANADVIAIDNGTSTQKITAENIKKYAIGNTNISGIGDGSVTGAIAALSSDILNTKIVYKSGSITLPSGQSGQTNTNIDITDILPVGYSAYSAIVKINTYALPYFATNSSGAVTAATWISVLDNTHLTIANTTSAWSNYTYYLTLICKKN